MLRVLVAVWLVFATGVVHSAYRYELEMNAARETTENERGDEFDADSYRARARVYFSPIEVEAQPYALAPFMTRASFAEVFWRKTYLDSVDIQPEVTGAGAEWQVLDSDFRVGASGEHDTQDEFGYDRYSARIGWFVAQNGELSYTHTRVNDREGVSHIRELTRRFDYQQVHTWAKIHIQFLAAYFESTNRRDLELPFFVPFRLGDDTYGHEWGMRFFPTQHVGFGVRYEETRRRTIPVPGFVVSGDIRERVRMNYLDISLNPSERFGATLYYGFGDRLLEFRSQPPFTGGLVFENDLTEMGLTATLRF